VIMSSNKSKIFWKAIGMLITYIVIMGAVIYFLNDCRCDKWKVITWGMFTVYGVFRCFSWYQREIEELNDKKK
ncbi:MAG: hypothetical protein K2G29_07925, partial [Muribaculaceae bacterium]|nr:hypothetical protein [Muribaculaceae bacterium]